jgi:hypothetical protein
MGFIIGHFLLVWVVAGFFAPRWLDVFIVPERRDDWKQPVAPGVLRGTTDSRIADSLESASPSNPSVEKTQSPMDGRPLNGHNDLAQRLPSRDSRESLESETALGDPVVNPETSKAVNS